MRSSASEMFEALYSTIAQGSYTVIGSICRMIGALPIALWVLPERPVELPTPCPGTPQAISTTLAHLRITRAPTARTRPTVAGADPTNRF